ncbi:T9SS type A sorting domain-containing protein [Psychroflexus aestuariivivens]|uniref:T9SS type A sorting domain-containing protein n=1 Tax=Psychroflexus aestuariivivens TaxID=1795040 RepID=UPI000FDA5A00|nr:T9SS type A sorting domain-containing protein [Psychroflexus aestuariivivens]
MKTHSSKMCTSLYVVLMLIFVSFSSQLYADNESKTKHNSEISTLIEVEDYSLPPQAFTMPIDFDTQVTENFANFPVTGFGYQSGSFSGVLANTWSYTSARSYPGTSSNGKTVVLNANMTSNLSSTIANGISEFSFDYVQAFSTNVNLQVYINGNQVANVTTNGEQGQIKNSGNIDITDISGNFTITFKNAAGGGQVGIDNFYWTQNPPAADYIYDNNQWTPESPEGNSVSTKNIQILSGTAVFNNPVEVNDINVLFGASLEIYSSVDLYGEILINGEVTFKSDATRTGQIKNRPGSSINGDVTVERFIPAGNNNRRAYRFLSSSLNSNGSIYANWQENGQNISGYGTHITGSESGILGFDATGTGNPSMFVLDNDGQAWYPVQNTNSTQLQFGDAYRIYIRGDRSIDLTDNEATPTNTVLRATGELFIGEFTPTIAQGNNEFSLIANPYQSTIDFKNLSFQGGVNVNHLYVWDANASLRGAYQLLSNTVDQFIRPGQSFFIVNSSTVNSPSVTFTESAKNPSGVSQSVFSNDESSTLKLYLYEAGAFNNNEREADLLTLNFDAQGNSNYDDFDAPKLPNLDENLATQSNNAFYTFETRALPSHEEEIDLFVNQFRSENYVFHLDLENFDDNFNVVLYDQYTGMTTIMDAEDYNFSVDTNIPESISNNRFQLSFENTTLGLNSENSSKNLKLFPNPVVDQLKISGLNDSEDVQITVFNLLGQNVTSYHLGQNEYSVDLSKLNRGVYLLKIKTGDAQVTKRIIKQ